MKYEFEISARQKIIVEAENAEMARMKIIDGEVGTILQSIDDSFIQVDPYVSEGKEV